ncbi:hypothetical protein CVT25_009051 [Psilocybe cyanescens]|uniref:Uncharacterized protein n=1 Tax=Psilocybe cyanescens TaxID=93625 RepID=A0A409XGP0_PSICY|nr:hypothetical protein CVT25_009051 [Psilocybe cyanescens]
MRAGGGHEGCLGARWTIRDSLKWAAQFSRAVSRGREGSIKPSKIRQSPVKSLKIPRVVYDVRIRLAMQLLHEALQTPRWIQEHANTTPLLPRGWVYQEQFLSTQTVHLHANEMVWACNVTQRCECKSLDRKPVDGDGWSASKDQVINLGETSKRDRKVLYRLWRTIVEDASLLDLTYKSNRLLSLAGLASRFAKYLPENERYLVGLWECDLACDLLWETGGSKQMAGPTRKQEMMAPLWLWAPLVWGGGESASGMEWEYETQPKLAEWAGVKTYKQDPHTRVISIEVDVDRENKSADVEMADATKPGLSIQSLIDKGLNARLKKLNLVPAGKKASTSYLSPAILDTNYYSNYPDIVWPEFVQGPSTQTSGSKPKPLNQSSNSKPATKANTKVDNKKKGKGKAPIKVDHKGKGKAKA